MLKFSHLSIRYKLTILIMLTSSAVLILSSVAFIAIEMISLRRGIMKDMKILAEITAKNCTAALAFNDREAAEQTLAALKTKPGILMGRIYDSFDTGFAEYRKPQAGVKLPDYIKEKKGQPLESLKASIARNDLEGFAGSDAYVNVFNDIVLDGDTIGTVYLVSNMDEMYVRLRGYTGIVLAVMLMGCCVSYLLSSKLQSVISVPILSLANTMQQVSREKTYSIRAEKQNNDEVGLLMDGFNQMLTRIQERDDMLEHHRGMLEEEVARQTEALSRTNTELTRMVVELKAAMQAAEAANEAKSQFLANMSHELRTPLHHIIGFIELIVARHFGALTDKQDEFLSDALQSSHHLLSLINDILDLSKVEAGKMPLQSSEFEPRALFEKSLIMFKEKTFKHAIQLKTEFADLPATIEADERKLKQILYNLLSNAVKFTPDGGSVILKARTTSVAGEWAGEGSDGGRRLPVENFRSDASDWLWISIADTGIGMSPDVLERIFTPFEQVENSLSRKYEGTGLGLPLTRRLIALHNGCIWAESEGEGKGSVFHLILPL